MADGTTGRARKPGVREQRAREEQARAEAAERAAAPYRIPPSILEGGYRPGFVESASPALLTESRCRHCGRMIYLSRGGAWESSGPCGDWHGYGLSHEPRTAAEQAQETEETKEAARKLHADDWERAAVRQAHQDAETAWSIADFGLRERQAPRNTRTSIARCIPGGTSKPPQGRRTGRVLLKSGKDCSKFRKLAPKGVQERETEEGTLFSWES